MSDAHDLDTADEGRDAVLDRLHEELADLDALAPEQRADRLEEIDRALAEELGRLDAI